MSRKIVTKKALRANGARMPELPEINIEAERYLIGAMLQWPESANQVFSLVTANNFHGELAAPVVAIMEQCWRSGEPIDAAGIYRVMADDGSPCTPYIPSFLAEAASAAPASVHIRFHATRLLEAHNRRQLALIGHKLSAGASTLRIDTLATEALWQLQHIDRARHDEADAEPTLAYRPFPAHLLPDPLDRFLKVAAQSIGCDPSYVGLPALVACASAIGNSRIAMVKEGWFEPSVLWGAVVGASGSQKSPALDAAIAPLHLRQAQAYRDYDLLVAEYQEARQRGEEEIRLPPSGPRRLLVLDTTVEGLIPVLKENGRGLLLVREEISGWLGSFDRYARGSVSDEASWLTMHGARSLCVDRKTGDHRTIHVSRAALSVVGTIQPGVLRKAIGTLRRESGLAARFLMVYPPRYRRRWNDVELDPQLQQQYADVLDRLLALEPDSEENGVPVPAVVRLDPEARQLFIAFFERNADEAWAMEEDMEAAYSKLEGGAVRFALVLAMIRGESIISAESMQAAIELIDWFKQEADRVYRMFSESEADRHQRELLEWIARKGGEVTVREVQQGHRRFKSADQAEAALDDLVKLGKVERQLVQTRTRPRYVFRLKNVF